MDEDELTGCPDDAREDSGELTGELDVDELPERRDGPDLADLTIRGGALSSATTAELGKILSISAGSSIFYYVRFLSKNKLFLK